MKIIWKNKKLIIIISVICIIAIIGIIIGANVIKVNIANGKYNSSNSESENGNLIPEYIKEGITLGGVTGTLKNLDTSDATAKPEDIIYGKTAYVDGVKIIGTKVTREMLEVGDYVEYTPDTASAYSLTTAVSGYTSNQSVTQETLKWRIMSINEDGTIDLVSEKATTQNIYLKGGLGYNNGVYVINDICKKQYSNKNLNVTARNLNKEDILDKMNSKGINAVNSTSNENSGTKYGKTRTYLKGSADTEYPNLYKYENGSGINSDTVKQDGIGLSDAYYSTPTNETLSTADKLTATQTYSYMQIQSAYFDDINFYNTIFKAQWSWLSTRFQNCAGNHVGFGLCAISATTLSGYNMYFAGQAFDDSAPLRPVVTLGANVEFSNGDGSIDKPYKISI